MAAAGGGAEKLPHELPRANVVHDSRAKSDACKRSSVDQIAGFVYTRKVERLLLLPTGRSDGVVVSI